MQYANFLFCASQTGAALCMTLHINQRKKTNLSSSLAKGKTVGSLNNMALPVIRVKMVML